MSLIVDIGCVCHIPDVPGVTRTITGLLSLSQCNI